MNAEIEEIQRQLHELRNYMGPVELLLVNMEMQIKKNRIELEEKIAALESRIDELLKLAQGRSSQLATAPPSRTRATPDAVPPGADV